MCTPKATKFEQQIVLLPPPPPFEIQEFFLEHVQLGTVLACGLAFSTPPPFRQYLLLQAKMRIHLN